MAKPEVLSIPIVAALEGICLQQAYKRFWAGHYGPAAALDRGRARIILAEYEAARGRPLHKREYDAAVWGAKVRHEAEEKARLSRAAKRAEVRRSIPSISTSEFQRRAA